MIKMVIISFDDNSSIWLVHFMQYNTTYLVDQITIYKW